MKREEELTAMTPERAIYFLERFKREEKMLGPNEKLALAYSIALLSTPKPEAVAHIVTDPKGRRRVTLATQYDPMASAFWINGEMPEGYSVTPLYAHPPKPEATEGGAHEKGIEPPVSAPLQRETAETWKQVVGLFRKHGLSEPPFRLRDELVIAFEWAWFGYRAALTAKQTDGGEG